MNIGILVAGHFDEVMIAKHGDIDAVLARVLCDEALRFTTYTVCDGHFPQCVSEADGWIISGSIHCANDDIPWINQLKDLTCQIVSADKPLVGICFGHQVIASALGGIVEPFSGGWAMGGHQYQIDNNRSSTRVIAWHQDQVIAKPDSAECIGSSPFCQFAFLHYPGKVFTMQPHPEFSLALARDLLNAKQHNFSMHQVDQVKGSLEQALDSALLHRSIIEFLRHRTLSLIGQ